MDKAANFASGAATGAGITVILFSAINWFLKKRTKKKIWKKIVEDPEILKKYNDFGRKKNMSDGQKGVMRYPYVKITEAKEIDSMTSDQLSAVRYLFSEMEKEIAKASEAAEEKPAEEPTPAE